MQCGHREEADGRIQIINDHEIVKWIEHPKCAVRELYVYQNIKHKHILPLIQNRPILHDDKIGIRLARAHGDLDHYFCCPAMRKQFKLDVFGLLYDTLSVLKVLHSHGIIHRDIKPANIFISRGVSPDEPHRIYLGDFGSACISWGKDECERFTDGVCSWFYAPPEDITGKLTPKFDLYCLGATVIHFLLASENHDQILPLELRPFDKNLAHLSSHPRCQISSKYSTLIDTLREMVEDDPSQRPDIDAIFARGLQHQWWSAVPDAYCGNTDDRKSLADCQNISPRVCRMASASHLRPCGMIYLQKLYGLLPPNMKDDAHCLALMYWVTYAIQETPDNLVTLLRHVDHDRKFQEISHDIIESIRLVSI